MQDNPTQPRPGLDRAIALIEVLHDLFETFDVDAYIDLPPSVQTLMSGLTVVVDAIEADPKNADEHDCVVGWLTNRIADLASENRRTTDLRRSERHMAFGGLGRSLAD